MDAMKYVQFISDKITYGCDEICSVYIGQNYVRMRLNMFSLYRTKLRTDAMKYVQFLSGKITYACDEIYSVYIGQNHVRMR